MLVVLRPAENHFSSPSSYYQSAPAPSPYRRSHYDADYYEFLQQRREEQEARDYAQFLYEKQQRAEAAKVARERQEAIARLQAYYEYRQRQYEQAQARARLEAAAQAKARYFAIQAERQRRIAQAEAEQQQQRQRQIQQQRHNQQQQAIANHIFASIMAAITEGSKDSAQPATPAVAATAKSVEPVKQSTTSPAKPAPAVACAPKSASIAPTSPPVVTFEKAIFIAQTGVKRRLSAERHVSAVRDLKQKFDETKATFTAPSSLVFDHDKSTSSAPVLAYSSDNKAFRAYEESLTKLLVELDKVETEGSQAVRAERKALAVAIEEELTRLDDIKAKAWAAQRDAMDASTVVAEESATPSVEDETILETSAAQTEEKVQDAPVAVQTEAAQKHEDIAKVATPSEAAGVVPVQAPEEVEGNTVEAPESVAARPLQAESEEPTHIEDIEIREPAQQAGSRSAQGDADPNEETSAGPQSLPFDKQPSEVDNQAVDIVAPSTTLSTPASPAVKADDKSTRVSDVDEDEDIEVSSESSFEMLE